MDAKLITIVERLVREQGKDTLIDAKKCKAHLADYSNNEFKKERHLLFIAIEAGAGKAIASSSELAICKKQQIRLLKDDRFIDETAAAKAIDLLALALRGDRSKSITAQSSANSQSQSSQSQPALNSNQPPQPTSASEILDRAKIALNNKNYQETIRLCNDAIRIDPNLALAYFSRGLAYHNLGDTSKAIADYTQAIKIKPKNALAYLIRGLAYGQLSDYDKAIADYNQAIKIDPNNAAAYGSRGIAYAGLSDYRSATKDARKACELGDCKLLQLLTQQKRLRD
ncbi:MAG: tetratricopeptide repeat protein [Helicobacteraceae bacterium]|jgi:tetratricopeptide (TPR) repeat protein|nr:tetratricopeptide repeat protein [Helicobacteraceae bacterium]